MIKLARVLILIPDMYVMMGLAKIAALMYGLVALFAMRLWSVWDIV
jgi:hypothetical protein